MATGSDQDLSSSFTTTDLSGDSLMVSAVDTVTLDSISPTVYVTWWTTQVLDSEDLNIYVAMETTATTDSSYVTGDTFNLAIGIEGFD